ncbi:MAG TPA: PilZ domain-containing protein [Pseudolabrys sp.]
MFGSVRRGKEQRKATRRKVSVNGFIRPDSGFAVRSCTIIDLSDTGIQISIDAPKSVPNTFTFMTSRTGTGRRATVKWRRGLQIGAEFV